MEAVGKEGSLLEGVRAFVRTGDRNAFRQIKNLTIDESVRASKLWKMLFNE